jgi:hypothetical protein
MIGLRDLEAIKGLSKEVLVAEEKGGEGHGLRPMRAVAVLAKDQVEVGDRDLQPLCPRGRPRQALSQLIEIEFH